MSDLVARGLDAYKSVPGLPVLQVNQQAVVASAQFATCRAANRFHAGNETHCVSNLEPMLRWGGWLRGGHHGEGRHRVRFHKIDTRRGPSRAAILSALQPDVIAETKNPPKRVSELFF